MKIRHFVVAAIALSAGTAAFASTQCTDAPKSGWLPEQAMKQKIADAGYNPYCRLRPPLPPRGWTSQ